MLTFDPTIRITVPDALEHPWLASYHDVADEPECPTKFEGWRKFEELETLDEFRNALWNEIKDFREEVRGVHLDLTALPIRDASCDTSQRHDENKAPEHSTVVGPQIFPEHDVETKVRTDLRGGDSGREDQGESETSIAPLYPDYLRSTTAPADPVVTYARRSSILQPSRQGSTYNSPIVSSHQHLPTYTENSPGLAPTAVAFPTQGYIVPARSRTASMAGGEVTRKLLRTLSTVSIHESAEGLAGGLGDIAPIGKFIVNRQTTGADAPPSEIPRDFGIEETSEGEESDGHEEAERKEGRFRIA